MLKHLLSWFIVTTLSIFLLPAMISPQTYLSKVLSDQKTLEVELGVKSAKNIIATSDGIYNKIFEESGFHPWVIQRYRLGEFKHNGLVKSDNIDKLGKVAEQYLTTFFISMYEAIYRLTQLAYWAMFSLPFILAATFDGLMQRKIRAVTFQYSSPSTYNTMWHLIIILFSATTIYCNLPLDMPAIVFPIIVFLFAILFRLLLTNLQQSA